MIICLKRILEKCFSFNINVNNSLKILWKLRGLSEGNQALATEGTWAYGGHLDTWALKGHSEGARPIKVLEHLGHSGTWALRHSSHLGTGDTLFSRLQF